MIARGIAESKLKEFGVARDWMDEDCVAFVLVDGRTNATDAYSPNFLLDPQVGTDRGDHFRHCDRPIGARTRRQARSGS